MRVRRKGEGKRDYKGRKQAQPNGCRTKYYVSICKIGEIMIIARERRGKKYE
jgi:hypothetical protein